MSARAPFVPGSRPASRAAHLQEQPQPTKKAFSPDVSNPLNANNGSGKLFPKLAAQQPGNANETPPTDATTRKDNKPLNTSSLLRKKATNAHSSTAASQKTGSMRKILDNAPSTVVPQDHGPVSGQDKALVMPSIVAPVPRQAARDESPLLGDPNTSFDVVQTSKKRQNAAHIVVNTTPTEARKEKRTHTVKSAINPPMPSQTPIQENAPSQLPSPPKSVRVPGNRVFENLRPASVKQGPVRATQDHSGILQLDDAFNMFENMIPAAFSASAKRHRDGQEEYDVSMESHGNIVPKRRRVQEDAYNQGFASGSVGSGQPSSPPQEYYEPTNFNSSPPDSHLRLPYHQQRPQTPLPAEAEAPGSSQMSMHAEGQFFGPLDRILDFNIEEYLEQNTAAYERSVTRWRNSTMEEWMAGSKEHIERWTKMLDYVMDYAKTKVQLYADLENKIKAHNKISDDREKTLAEVKERLVDNIRNNDFVGHV